MSEIVVRIENLKKSYGAIVALDGISLELESGKIFGLLGPNGAGKTTAVKIMTTLLRPDQGKIEIAEADLPTDPYKVRGLIGHVPRWIAVFDGAMFWLGGRILRRHFA
jgi:ABC-type multidrug transport system ATPase subunit